MPWRPPSGPINQLELTPLFVNRDAHQEQSSSGLYQQKVMRSHQAFDRDFRPVPSERPALHFEGTLR
jgi:hypothetical protein